MIEDVILLVFIKYRMMAWANGSRCFDGSQYGAVLTCHKWAEWGLANS